MAVNVLRGSTPAPGSGDGYGSGYGDGSGSGSGYGDGDGYWTAVLAQHPDTTAARTSGAEIAFWRSDSEGRPSNGGSGTVAKIGLVEELPGPLNICNRGTLHATMEPGKWKGERLWIVAMHGEIQRDDDKIGALKREFLAEVKW